jgi:hypothetical protein
MSKSNSLANEQVDLIREYQQNGGLPDDKLCYLIKSLHGIARKLGEKWEPSFDMMSCEEIAAEADFATFLALNKFDTERGVCPSTFFYRVMNTHIAKKWHHDRTRCVRVDTDKKDEKTGRTLKLHLQKVSLDSYVDEHGDIDELGRVVTDVDERVSATEKIDRLEELCINDLTFYRVVTRIISLVSSSVKKLRANKIVETVSYNLGISTEDVMDVVETVNACLDEDDDIMKCLCQLKHRLDNRTMHVDICDLVLGVDVGDVVDLMRWTGKL